MKQLKNIRETTLRLRLICLKRPELCRKVHENRYNEKTIKNRINMLDK